MVGCCGMAWLLARVSCEPGAVRHGICSCACAVCEGPAQVFSAMFAATLDPCPPTGPRPPPHTGRVRPGPRIHALLTQATPGPVAHHGFRERPLCKVPLVLRLWTSAPAHVVVELGEAARGAGDAVGTAVQRPPAHVWTGHTRRALGVVRACAELELELEAVVSRPGRHALSDVSLAWGAPGSRQLDGSRTVPGCLIHVVEQAGGPGPGTL